MAWAFLQRFQRIQDGRPGHVGITTTNWRPLFMTALLIAQKVTSTNPLCNEEFQVLCPTFSHAEVCALEARLLQDLSHDINVDSREYDATVASLHGQVQKACTSHFL